MIHQLLVCADKSISEGKLLIEVAYYGWYIHSEDHDLCGETSCPATGDFVISHSQVLPGITPPVSYICHFLSIRYRVPIF